MAFRKCLIETCNAAAHAKGYCNIHYARLKRGGNPLKARRYGRDACCAVEGCGKRHHSHGYCGAHAQRHHRHNDPTGGDPERGNVKQFYYDTVLNYPDEPSAPCLIWPFSRDRKGYAQMRTPDRTTSTVSRRLCEDVHGPAPTPDHQAAHSCGNGHLGCVTKGHLRWATRAENEADKIAHGSSNRGERHGMAKLTEADVLEIRRLRGHRLQREIAQQFGIAGPTVSYIQQRKAWAWL